MARYLHSNHANHDCLPNQQLHSARVTDHPMRAQIPGRHDDARRNHAGGIGIQIVQAAFNWLVDNYPGLADWTASARRVALLQMSLDELERAEIGRVGRINRCERKGAALRLRNLSVTLDDRTLVTGAEVAI